LIYLGSQFLVFLATKVLLRLARKTKTMVDDLIVEKTHRPLVYVLVFWGLRFSINILELTPKLNEISNHIFDSLIIILITTVIIRVVDILISEWGGKWSEKTSSTLDDELLPIFHAVSKVIFVVLSVIYVMKAWAIDVSGLLAGIGIAGIALSFAVKDSLANIFGGISLILDRTFRVGDIVKVDDTTSGKILNISLRSTRIRTWDGEVVIVPNSIVANSKLTNVMQPDMAIRVNIEFGTVYGSDPDKVKKVAKETITKIKGVSKEQDVKVLFLSMGDFSLNFKAMFWVDDLSNKWDMHQKAIAAVYNALNKAKIGIPFPTHTVHIADDKKKPVRKAKGKK